MGTEQYKNRLIKDLEDVDASVEVLHYEEKAYTGLSYGMEKYYPTWKLSGDHPVIMVVGGGI